MLSKLKSGIRKMLPIVLVLGFVVISGSTNWLSTQVHAQMVKQLNAFSGKLMPFALNAAIGFLIVYGAWLLYGHTRNTVNQLLARSPATEKGRRLVILTLQAVYWFAALYIAASFVAPDFLSKAFLGFSILSAALALALQDAAKNIIASICLHTMPKCAEGDTIEVIGTDEAKGKLTKVGYFNAEIAISDSKTGRKMIVPNSTLWNSPMVIGEPEPEDDEKDKDAETPKVVVVHCCNPNCPCAAAEASSTGTASVVPAPDTRTAAADAAVVSTGGSESESASAQTASPTQT